MYGNPHMSGTLDHRAERCQWGPGRTSKVQSDAEGSSQGRQGEGRLASAGELGRLRGSTMIMVHCQSKVPCGSMWSCFFPTSLCGVLVFGCALPPARSMTPAALTHNFTTQLVHTQLVTTHTLSPHNLSTHNLLTTQLVHTQLVHTQLAHTQLIHTQLIHTTCSHTTCPRTTSPHNLSTQLVHTQLVHTQLVTTQLVHTQLVHTQLAHRTTCPHTTCPHITCSHTTWPHTTCSHTTSPHTTCSHNLSTHNLLTHNLFTHNFSTHNLLTHNLSTHNLLTHNLSAGVALMALDWLWWRACVSVWRRGRRSPWLLAWQVHFAWQAWHLVTSTFTLRGRRGTYGTGPISSRMCCRCPFRSRQGHFLHGRHVLDGRHVANIHEILTIFFAFLLVSFDLSCGQVPFRLHHAHAAASTRGKNIPHACSQHVRCPTFQYIHTYTHTHTHAYIPSFTHHFSSSHAVFHIQLCHTQLF